MKESWDLQGSPGVATSEHPLTVLIDSYMAQSQLPVLVKAPVPQDKSSPCSSHIPTIPPFLESKVSVLSLTHTHTFSHRHVVTAIDSTYECTHSALSHTLTYTQWLHTVTLPPQYLHMFILLLTHAHTHTHTLLIHDGGWHCGIVDKAAPCNVSNPPGYRFNPQLFHFRSSFLITCLGRQQMAQ